MIEKERRLSIIHEEEESSQTSSQYGSPASIQHEQTRSTGVSGSVIPSLSDSTDKDRSQPIFWVRTRKPQHTGESFIEEEYRLSITDEEEETSETYSHSVSPISILRRHGQTRSIGTRQQKVRFVEEE